MCGTLKYEMISKKIGKPVEAIINQVVTIEQDGKVRTIRWLGHSREESGPPKLPHKLVKVHATEYTEKNVLFNVPEGKAIAGYSIKSKNFPGGEGLFLITRNATSKELQRCKHPRHPKFINKVH